MGKKKTYTYAADMEAKEKADRKAKREKTTLSEKIDGWIKEYVAPVPKRKDYIPLPEGYVNIKDVHILNVDGTASKI